MARTRTRILKVHETAYKNLVNKKIKMQQTLKVPNIKFTHFMDFISTRTIYADDDELKNFFLKQKRNRGRTWCL